MDLQYVCEALEMNNERFLLKHHHYEFFSIIQVVKRLERLFKKNRETVRVEVEDQGFTPETREGLEGLGVQITPASQGGVFGNASGTTFVYDARRFQTDLQKHIKDNWEPNDGSNSKLPAAVITDRMSVRLGSGSPKIDPLVEKEYYFVSLSSRVNHFRHEGGGTMAQAKGLAQFESHLTQD
ncbi:hypothetical protein INS49_013537 [Diaporthe citri]|uniref:uncharacterized protein n=1 Tax=Diaporthe citri TaxID=83186 RepID=UPI001C808A11|nr:uncharacterized protein INS49_013537 [Diaporthe citri]KAG6357658.1 hypothetical protein INS49_013537 [Diaporthe citri]